MRATTLMVHAETARSGWPHHLAQLFLARVCEWPVEGAQDGTRLFTPC